MLAGLLGAAPQATVDPETRADLTPPSEVVNFRDWGIQLGRRFRALKLWFLLRAHGLEGLREMIRKFQVDPSDPQSLRTTLVLQLQEAAVAALGRNHGAVVMLNPRNGEVLALASTPTFNASGVANPVTSARIFE